MYRCVIRLLSGYILQQCIHMSPCVTLVQNFCQRVMYLLHRALCRRLHNSKNNGYLVVKRYSCVCTGLRKAAYHDTVFENVTTVYKKKSPGQPARARVAGRATLQFSRLEGSLQALTVSEPLACKHKNNSANNNVSLRVTTVDVTHFTTVCATRARVTRVQDFVIGCSGCYSMCYIVRYTDLKVMNTSR